MDKELIKKLLIWSSGNKVDGNYNQKSNITVTILGAFNILIAIVSIFVFYFFLSNLHLFDESIPLNTYPSWLLAVISVTGSFLIFFLLRFVFSFQGNITRFFWWCSGADIEILEECPTEHSKYFGIGGTILFTAVMATLAGGYAFYTAFYDPDNPLSSTLTAVVFGIFWGSLIFNLDRYIVSTFGVGDGKKTISWGEFKSALPRMLMAMVLGFVIATPLEIKIFNKEIEVELEKMKAEERINFSTTNNPYRKEIKAKEQELEKANYDWEKINNKLNNINLPDDINQRLKNAQKAKTKKEEHYNKIYSDWYQKYWITTSGHECKDTANLNISYTEKINLCNKIKNRKIVYTQHVTPAKTSLDHANNDLKKVEKERNNYLERENKEILQKRTQINSIIDNLRNEINILKQKDKSWSAKTDTITNNYNGFMAKLIALDRLTYTTKTKIVPVINNDESSVSNHETFSDSTVISLTNIKKPEEASATPTFKEETVKEWTPLFYAKWLITALFVLIEIAPILFKMMMEEGPYDYKINRIKKTMMNDELKKISDFNENISFEVKLNTEKNKRRMEAEIKMTDEILNEIELATTRIAKNAIKQWEKEQLDKDPANFLIKNKS